MSAEPITPDGRTVRPGRWSPDADAARRLADRVLEQLADHLSDADKHAPEYVREYAQSVVTNKGRPTSAKLHPKVAALIRDLTLDEVVTERRGSR